MRNTCPKLAHLDVSKDSPSIFTFIGRGDARIKCDQLSSTECSLCPEKRNRLIMHMAYEIYKSLSSIIYWNELSRNDSKIVEKDNRCWMDHYLVKTLLIGSYYYSIMVKNITLYIFYQNWKFKYVVWGPAVSLNIWWEMFLIEII